LVRIANYYSIRLLRSFNKPTQNSFSEGGGVTELRGMRAQTKEQWRNGPTRSEGSGAEVECDPTQLVPVLRSWGTKQRRHSSGSLCQPGGRSIWDTAYGSKPFSWCVDCSV